MLNNLVKLTHATRHLAVVDEAVWTVAMVAARYIAAAVLADELVSAFVDIDAVTSGLVQTITAPTRAPVRPCGSTS